MSNLNRTFDLQLDKETKQILLKRKIGANWTTENITDEIIQLVSEFFFLEAEEDAEVIAVKFKRGTVSEE